MCTPWTSNILTITPIEKENILRYLSSEIGRAKRVEELIVLDAIINKKAKGYSDIFDYVKMKLEGDYGIILDEVKKQSIISNLLNKFPIKAQRKKFEGSKFIEEESHMR